MTAMPMQRNAPLVRDPYGVFSRMGVPTDLLTEARQQLQAQANPAAAATDSPIATPNQDQYGIFGPQYAAALARSTGASGADAVNMSNLASHARGEPAAYEHALERAQAGAVQLRNLQGYYDVLTSSQAHEPNRIISDTHHVETGPDGRAVVVADPLSNAVDNQLRGNASMAGTRKDNAAAIHDLYQSGIQPDPNVVGGYMTAPTQAQQDQYGVFNQQGYNPADQTDALELPIKQLEAEAAMVAAEAARQRAINGEGGNTTYQYYPGATEPVITQRVPGGHPMPPRPGTGAPNAVGGPTPQQQHRMSAVQGHGAQVQMSGNILIATTPDGRRYLYGPDGEPITQPPPGQGRGGAHPAAFSLNGVAGTRSHSSPTRIREHGNPIADANVAIQTIFPGVHVNQWTRDPNSPLGRANPNSWHNRSRAAVDIHPIRGMNFQQAAQMIRNQGYRIIEGRDEVNDPSPHATGPHWHFVLGRG